MSAGTNLDTLGVWEEAAALPEQLVEALDLSRDCGGQVALWPRTPAGPSWPSGSAWPPLPVMPLPP